MSPIRKRTLGLFVWLALIGAAIRPIGPLEGLLGMFLAPLRVVAELASPLWILRGPEVRAAEQRLRASQEAEARSGEQLLEALARFATPRDSNLVRGRRLVHAEVIGRGERSRDVIRIRLRDARGIEPGLPVVGGEVFVGRVQRLEPVDAEDLALGGVAEVELVTSRHFHVGARVTDDGGAGEIDMTVGGLDLGPRGPRRGRPALALQNPSDRALEGGLAVVHERLAEIEPHARLAEGYLLGRVRREGEEHWCIEPELDYLDGLFHVVVLAPPDSSLPSDEPLPQALSDRGWRRARPLSHGDPSPWRETLRIAAGTTQGVRPGAALAFGARFVGRVGDAGPWSADARLLGDVGLEVVAVGLFEGEGRPRVLGRLTSLGRDPDGAVRFRATGGEPLPLEPDGPDGRRSARLFNRVGGRGRAQRAGPRRHAGAGRRRGGRAHPAAGGSAAGRPAARPVGAHGGGGCGGRFARSAIPMNRRSPWPWIVLLIWCAWIYALLGRLASEPGVRGWVPDLGLVLLLGLEPRLSARDALRAALLVAAARAAFSADAPTAILAGSVGAVWISGALRNVVESDAALPRAAVTGLCALLFGLLLAFVHRARLGGSLACSAAAPPSCPWARCCAPPRPPPPPRCSCGRC